MGQFIAVTMGLVLTAVVFVGIQATIDLNDGRVEAVVSQLQGGRK